MVSSPRGRLEKHGAPFLSDAELLAILLRMGSGEENALQVAERLLKDGQGLRGLARLSYAELADMLGAARAASVLAALELGRRLISREGEERPVIRTAEDAARLIMLDMESLTQEHLRVILLDATRRVMSVPTVYIGSLNMTVVRIAEVFREAIIRNAPTVVLVHNHPSGDPTPSEEDFSLTEKLVEAGKLLDIMVLDHVIIGRGNWVSLRDTGLHF